MKKLSVFVRYYTAAVVLDDTFYQHWAVFQGPHQPVVAMISRRTVESRGSMLIWPRPASVCDDNGAADLHYAAVVWLIPDCSLSGAFTSLITF